MNTQKPSFRLNAFQALAIGFAALIFLGAVLLALPISSRDGTIPFLDALFTATSAACVTGLAIYDTYSQFTFFGQAIMLCLIQIGGLGFMMMSILVSILIGRRIGLYERSLLMESVGALKIGGIVRLTKRILTCTAVIELCGAVVLLFWFCPRFGPPQGLWMAVFHSVSAFCNAGFDLMGIVSPGSSLTTAAADPLLNITIMLLIISGGLGFLLWSDVLQNKFHFSKYSLHTKIVLSTTAIFVVGGAVIFFLMEYNHAFAGMGAQERILSSFFQSVSPRTAGFNTVPLDSISDAGILFTMFLMFVGAGSGSTGGGIKINTFAVLVLSILAFTRHSDDVNVFHRRVDTETLKKTFPFVTLYGIVCFVGCLVLCAQGIPFKGALFEAISAVGTVGLSLGVSPTLPVLSKLTIILLMYIGRVGSLAVVMAIYGNRTRAHIRNVSEKILIG